MFKKVIKRSYYSRDNIPVKEKDSYKTISEITIYLFSFIPVFMYKVVETKY